MTTHELVIVAERIHNADFGPIDISVVPYRNSRARKLELAQSMASYFEREDVTFNRFAFIHLCMTGENRF